MEIMPPHSGKAKHREQINFLSPSLFSLDPPVFSPSSGNMSTGEVDALQMATNIPTLLGKVFGDGKAGLRDSNEWLNFIMEAANVSEQVESLEREIVGLNLSTLF